MHFEKSLSGCIGEKQVRTVEEREAAMEVKRSGWRLRLQKQC